MKALKGMKGDGVKMRKEHTCVSIKKEQLETLKAIAEKRDVSISWLIRQGIEKYLLEASAAQS